MADPASYPPNDGAEARAVTLVESMLDRDLVKTNFSKRDKFPNIDGFLEIVRKSGRSEIPIAKLDVQIKTLEPDAMQFQCPASLVAYAQTVTTLPVLLICADTKSGRVFWKHVHRAMREFKDGQDTFVVKFDAAVQSIDIQKTYLPQWQRIAEETIARMAGYAVLKSEVRAALGLGSLPAEAVASIQRFLDRMNSLLDGELAIVKALDFPNVWKLGVAVQCIGRVNFGYHIFAVPYGAGSPLIIDRTDRNIEDVFTALRERRPDPLGLTGYGTQNFHSSRWQMNANGIDPESSATEFVLGLLKERVKLRRLRIAGTTVATETLFQFMDDFGHTTGVVTADSYDVAALNYGLKVYFATWYGLALKKFFDLNRELLMTNRVFPPFESVAGMMPHSARPTVDEVVAHVGSPIAEGALLIRTTTFDFQTVIGAVDVLQEAGVRTISRPYGKRASCGGLIWDGFEPGEGEKRLRFITKDALEEYELFLAANFLSPPKRHLEKSRCALVYRFAPADKPSDRPWIEWIKISPPGDRPPISVARTWTIASRTVSIEGTDYSLIGRGTFGANTLFVRNPMLAAIYSMLERDLMLSYGIERWTTEPSLL